MLPPDIGWRSIPEPSNERRLAQVVSGYTFAFAATRAADFPRVEQGLSSTSTLGYGLMSAPLLNGLPCLLKFVAPVLLAQSHKVPSVCPHCILSEAAGHAAPSLTGVCSVTWQGRSVLAWLDGWLHGEAAFIICVPPRIGLLFHDIEGLISRNDVMKHIPGCHLGAVYGSHDTDEKYAGG